MKAFDTSELLKHIGEVLGMVEEEGETIEISNHREAIAYLVPAAGPQSLTKPTKRDVWADLERLAAEIDAHWSPHSCYNVDTKVIILGGRYEDAWGR